MTVKNQCWVKNWELKWFLPLNNSSVYLENLGFKRIFGILLISHLKVPLRQKKRALFKEDLLNHKLPLNRMSKVLTLCDLWTSSAPLCRQHQRAERQSPHILPQAADRLTGSGRSTPCLWNGYKSWQAPGRAARKDESVRKWKAESEQTAGK